MTSTIGIDLQEKVVTIDGATVKLTVWDTAGQERFRSMAASYYKGSDGVVMVYDISRKASFEGVSRWMEDLSSRVSMDSVDVVLVGNKADIDEARREVTEAEGRGLAGKLKTATTLFETSCRDGRNVQDAFMALATAAYRRKVGALKAGSAAGKGDDRVTMDGDDGGGARRGKCCK